MEVICLLLVCRLRCLGAVIVSVAFLAVLTWASWLILVGSMPVPDPIRLAKVLISLLNFILDCFDKVVDPLSAWLGIGGLGIGGQGFLLTVLFLSVSRGDHKHTWIVHVRWLYLLAFCSPSVAEMERYWVLVSASALVVELDYLLVDLSNL